MKKYLIGLTFGCAICLEPTLAFANPTPTVQGTTSNVSGASISGAVMYQAPNGAVTTVTGQITLPQNYYYSGSATVSYGTNESATNGVIANTNAFRPTSLTLGPDKDAGNSTIQQVNADGTIAAITATELKEAFDGNPQNLSKAISIIRAAGGANGLE